MAGGVNICAHASSVKHLQFRGIRGSWSNNHGYDSDGYRRQIGVHDIDNKMGEKYVKVVRRTNIADCDIVIAAFPQILLSADLPGGCCKMVYQDSPFQCDVDNTFVTDIDISDNCIENFDDNNDWNGRVAQNCNDRSIFRIHTRSTQIATETTTSTLLTTITSTQETHEATHTASETHDETALEFTMATDDGDTTAEVTATVAITTPNQSSSTPNYVVTPTSLFTTPVTTTQIETLSQTQETHEATHEETALESTMATDEGMTTAEVTTTVAISTPN
ncbi:hypothetical protein HDU76_012582 [Blyttiomyces sp. JEL0837]|nr:hypothetical protein HDU76_012582 [Blyttiomyces sp. JEL0837]